MMQTDHAGMPLRFGSTEDYALVTGALAEADFTEETLCRILSLGNMSDLSSDTAQNTDLNGVPPRLALFIRLFLFFETVPRFEMEFLLKSETIGAFLALDILRPAEENATDYYTSVFLYPIAGFYITSDRPVDIDGVVRTPDDWVLPAIYEGTLTFLRLLATTPAQDVLDLCAGTGVGAMALSRSAENAIAVDITPRAAHYASFNKALNQLDNVEVVEGDLYNAVACRTFDRIIAHPPYVPALRPHTVYSDGGETGEHLVRRIIEGLPAHLRSGGIYYSVSYNIDTEHAPFEERVRQWLGPSQQDFDILFAQEKERSVDDVVETLAAQDSEAGYEDISRLRLAFAKIAATRFVYGALVIRRRTPQDSGAPRTLRTTMSETTTGVDLEKILNPLDIPGVSSYTPAAKK